MIINHSTAYEQSLYLVMKRIAGEHGSCFASLNFLSKKMGIHKTTVSKTIKKLLKRKWVSEIEHKKVKGGIVRQFIIVDLWRLNIDLYESGAEMTTNESGAVVVGSGAVVDGSGAQSDIKKNYKEDIEEDTETSSDIPLLIKEFEKLNPASKKFYGYPPQRKACADLIETYGFDRVRGVVEKTLSKTNGIPYFPVITTPIQLRDKWVSLESAIRKYQSEKLSTTNKYPKI